MAKSKSGDNRQADDAGPVVNRWANMPPIMSNRGGYTEALIALEEMSIMRTPEGEDPRYYEESEKP